MKRLLCAGGVVLLVLLASLILVGTAATVDPAATAAASDGGLANALLASGVGDMKTLDALFAQAQEEYLPIAPPDPAFVLNQPLDILVFDPAGFSKEFIEGLVPQKENGVAVYPVGIAQDPKTRETVFFNAEGQEIYAVPPRLDYNPYALFERLFPRAYELDDQEFWAWVQALFDPARIEVTIRFLAVEDVDAYVAGMPRLAPAAKRSGGGGMMKLWTGTVTNLEFVATEAFPGRVVLTLAWPAAPTFTNIDIYASSNLLIRPWTLAGTTNTLTVSTTNCLEWTVMTTNPPVSPRVFLAANADQDQDHDGIPDGREIFLYGLSPTNVDSDGDGLVDGYSGVVSNSAYAGGVSTNGATVEGEATWGTDPNLVDTDGDGMGDGWEVAHGHNPLNPNDPPNVRGTIQYAGRQTGTVWVVAVTSSNSWSTNRCAVLPSVPGAYLIPDLELTNYFLKAFMDTDGNGQTGFTEAVASHPSNPLVITNRVLGADLTLVDADSDSDSLPDWWEIRYFGSVTNWTGAGDPDADQYTNLEEYEADTDPTNGTNHPWNVGGTVAYTGAQTGVIYVIATVIDNWSTNHSVTLTATGSSPFVYTITHLPPNANYWVKAWRDSSGDGSNTFWEAQGVYVGDPVYLDANLTNIAITLADPDSDGDSVPDWWEVRYGFDPNGPQPPDAAWWKLDETTGPNASDSTANGNNGVFRYGAAGASNTWTTGVIGNGLALTGTNYVQVNDSASLKPEYVSVSAWVRPGRDYTNGTGVGAVFFSKKAPGAAAGYSLSYEQGALKFWIYATGAKTVSWSCALTNGVWVHVAGSYSGPSQTLYVDGAPRASAYYDWGTSSSSLGQGTNAARLGASTDAVVSNVLAGVLDDVRVYDWGLASNEVHALYELGVDPDHDGLSNWQEGQLGTSPTNTDTDGDGLSDSAELVLPVVVSWRTATNAAVRSYGMPANAVAGGYQHSLALLSNGQVVAWGNNDCGQSSVPSNVTHAVAIAAGDGFSVALLNNGQVAAWGDDWSEQTYVPASATNAVAIAVRGYHSLALLGNGHVVAWGADWEGETVVPSNVTNAVAIATGDAHSLALLTNGRLVGWGALGGAPASVTNATAIAAGDAHALALLADGHVVAWGDNGSGETNVPASVTNAVAIAAGTGDSAALLADGRVVVWGNNDHGQTNVPVSVTNAVAIDAQGACVLALTRDGQVRGWGSATDCGVRGGFTTCATRSDAESMAIGQMATDPTRADTDGDGFLDGWELTHGFNPQNPSDTGVDTDGDGLTDGMEALLGTNPLNVDTDGDWLRDGLEVNLCHTDPLDPDTDGDGMPDGWEVNNGLDPTVNDASGDPDEDGLSNLAEYQAGTNGTYGTYANQADSDQDGLDDGQELAEGTDPLNGDTDGDGMADGWEVAQRDEGEGLMLLSGGPNPLVSDGGEDSNGNGISNIDEFRAAYMGVDVTVCDLDGSDDSWALLRGNQVVASCYKDAPGSNRIYVAYGTNVVFGLRWLNAGQMRGTDEYLVSFTPLWNTNQWVANDYNSALADWLYWEDDDETPPATSNLVWEFTVLKVGSVEASSLKANNSPQIFEGYRTDFGDPCDPDEPGQALAIFHKDVRDANFVVQDYDVTLKAHVLPAGVTADRFSESWEKVAGPASGSLNPTNTFEVKYQNAKVGGLYRFAFDLGLSGCPKSGANLLLPLGGPSVIDYYLAEEQRYDTWLTTMKTRVYGYTSDTYLRGSLILAYFTKTVANMNHKQQTFEAGNSPCNVYCAGTVTISDYVFGKDHIGNFLFSYLAARTALTFGTARFGANLVALLTDKVPDTPDDQAAYTAGYAHGQNPTTDFKTILESKDINTMQTEPAKRGWPSSDTATGGTYPTWGATHAGLKTPD